MKKAREFRDLEEAHPGYIYNLTLGVDYGVKREPVLEVQIPGSYENALNYAKKFKGMRVDEVTDRLRSDELRFHADVATVESVTIWDYPIAGATIEFCRADGSVSPEFFNVYGDTSIDADEVVAMVRDHVGDYVQVVEDLAEAYKSASRQVPGVRASGVASPEEV